MRTLVVALSLVIGACVGDVPQGNGVGSATGPAGSGTGGGTGGGGMSGTGDGTQTPGTGGGAGMGQGRQAFVPVGQAIQAANCGRAGCHAAGGTPPNLSQANNNHQALKNDAQRIANKVAANHPAPPDTQFTPEQQQAARTWAGLVNN